MILQSLKLLVFAFLFRAFERQVLIGTNFCAQQVAVCVADFGIRKTHESIELFKVGASVFMSHNTRSQSFSIVLNFTRCASRSFA